MKKIIPATFVVAVALLFFGCGKGNELCELVSEYRSAVYTAESGDAALQAYYSQKEYPYAADGVAAAMTSCFEVQATLPDNTLTYTVSFRCGEKSFGGEMSYDSVRQVFCFSQSMEEPSEETMTFTVTAEGENAPAYTFEAKKAGKDLLTLRELLSRIDENKKSELEQFGGKQFGGEIYVRLMVKDEKCYYYVGFIDRSGKCLSFLADAQTGEVLATKSS